MKRITTSLFLLLAGAAVNAHAQCQVYSLLGNINCGGGQSTCYKSSFGQTGAVRCTCTADCLAAGSITESIGATKAVQWGVGAVCANPLTGTAQGGTSVGNNPSRLSAVFATVSISGATLVLLNNPSTTVVDCFGGTIENDPDIGGLC